MSAAVTLAIVAICVLVLVLLLAAAWRFVPQSLSEPDHAGHDHS